MFPFLMYNFIQFLRTTQLVCIPGNLHGYHWSLKYMIPLGSRNTRSAYAVLDSLDQPVVRVGISACPNDFSYVACQDFYMKRLY